MVTLIDGYARRKNIKKIPYALTHTITIHREYRKAEVLI